MFEDWCWRRHLRVPWTERRSNQSTLKEINPECSLEGLMLKLKLQYFGQLTHWERPWCCERLRAGEEGGNRRWDGWVASLPPWTWVWANSGRWWRTGRHGVLQSIGLRRVGRDWTRTTGSASVTLSFATSVITGKHNCLPPGDNLAPPPREGLWHSLSMDREGNIPFHTTCEMAVRKWN